MATIEITVVDKSGKIVPNVRINGSYQSMFGAALGKFGGDYKVYAVKTDGNGKCRFNINKDFYIWSGFVSREKAKSIEVSANQTQATLRLDQNIEKYKVQHIFKFIDLEKKNIDSNPNKNQLLYRISKDQGKTWKDYTALTNPLLIDSHLGEVITVKLYTTQDKYDILKETGKNHYLASKYQSLGENFLDNVIVPIKYINTKTGQNKPMTAKQEDLVKKIIIQIKGKMKTSLYGDGVLRVLKGEKELNKIFISAGGFGSGAPPNGQYFVDTYKDRSPTGWYNKGMNRSGVGFSFNLEPRFSTQRSLLRIHPDGNNPGTLGCIGLLGNKEELIATRDAIRQIIKLSTNKKVECVIDIDGNPNNHKPPKRVKGIVE